MCINKLSNANNNKPEKDIKNESSLLSKPSPNLKLLVNQFNNATLEDNKTDLDSDFFSIWETRSRIFTIYSTAGEGGTYLFKSPLPLPPASQTLRH